MRRKSFVFLMAFLVLCTGALMVACPPPGGPHLTKASLRIHIGNNIVARTIAPPSDATTVASYSVSGNGPNGASFGPLPVAGDSATVDGLAFGSWTVKVDALNAKGDIIGHGESSTTVASGDNSVTVSVLLASGWGSLSLTVTWKTSQVQGPGSVSASITSATGGSALPLTPFTGSDGSLSSTTSGLSPGYYILNLNLLDRSRNIVGSTTDLVWIVNAQTSTGGFDFTDAVTTGSIKVSLTPLPNPLNVSISQSGGTASAVVANYSGTDLTYQWYLNGVAVGTNSSNYTLPSTPGCYWISTIVWATNWAQAGSATTTFQVGAVSAFSLVGSWNSSRAWFKNSPINQFAADGTFIGWEDYAETIENNNGTWSLTGNTLTETFLHGGPGAGVSLSGTVTWVNANQGQFSMTNPPASVTSYRKGFEPDGYLFNNPKYPPISLVRDTIARGTLASDGLVLYQYVAGPNAQNTVISLTGVVQLYMYQSDEQTFVDRMSRSTQTVVLAPYQMYYVVAVPGPLSSGDYSILMAEAPDYAGTWVNPAYNGNGPQLPGKVVFAANSVALFLNDTDATPVVTYPLTFTGDWIASDGHYFRVIVEVSPPPNPSPSYRYALARVSNNNSVLEVNSSATDYPTSIDQNGEGYQIYHRQ